jgi:acetyltransferase-like isoleucine patch superfamily enzyme
MVCRMPSASGLLRRLEREYWVWRTEPIKRVAVRNRLIHPLRVRRFASFGPDSFVDRPQWLYGTQKISVGAGVIILEGSWLAVERVAWEQPGPVLTIGDRVAIRVACCISAANSITIEDDVGMGGYVTVIDSKHTWSDDSPNPLYGPIDSAPIRIGRGTWLADRVTIAAGADIGQQCAIGPNSVVTSKVADFSIVVGNPGRVVGSTRT